MCLAIPAQVKSIDEKTFMGEVDILGVKREVAMELVPKAKVGDYVLVHAGYGIEVIDEQTAEETLELIEEFPDLVDSETPGMGRGAM